MPKIEKSEKELLEDIKNLLILQLAKAGATDVEVAKTLKCGASTLRKNVSFAGNKKKNG